MTDVKRNARGHWLPGQSACPGGIYRGGWTAEMHEAMALARKLVPAAVKRLGELIEHEDPHVSHKAVQTLLNRVYGAPKQPVELAASGDEGADAVAAMSREDRAVLLEQAAAAERAAIEREKIGQAEVH